MIAIINREWNEDDPEGECKYEVMINHRHICWFTHVRRDGLAVCLQKAALAVQNIDPQVLGLFDIADLCRQMMTDMDRSGQ